MKANKRYKEVIGETDYKKACYAIKAAGYATDLDYAEKLIKIIEQYNLTEFDGTTERRKTRQREQPGQTIKSTTGYRLGLTGEGKALTLWRSSLRRPDIRTYS